MIVLLCVIEQSFNKFRIRFENRQFKENELVKAKEPIANSKAKSSL